MDTISGLAESLSAKADINTVYAEPMSTNYTTRNEVLEASKTIKYPLNGINNNYALHAFVSSKISFPLIKKTTNSVLFS
jgi:1-deoxy-D-xylulose 5-phosphate reductoisomerase